MNFIVVGIHTGIGKYSLFDAALLHFDGGFDIYIYGVVERALVF